MSLLDFLDIVSYKPKLHVFQKLRYPSLIGKLIGLFTITTISIIFTYFTIILLEKKELIIIYNETSSINKIVNLTSTPFIFTLIDGNSSPIDKSLFEIRVNLWNWSYHNNNTRTFDIVEFPLESCDEEKHFGSKKDLFKNIDIKSSFCLTPDKNNILLYGKYSLRANDYSFVNIAINMCNNKTTNNLCPTKEIIGKKLKNVFLSLIYADYEVDHEDIHNPLKLQVTGEFFPLNWDIHNRYYYSFKNIIHNTDDGIILESRKIREGYYKSVNTYTAQIRHDSLLYPGLTFATITIIKDQKTSLYLRNYMKLQNLLAKLGGVINVILMIGKFFNYTITRNLFLRELYNINFFLEQSNVECTNTNNSIKGFQKREITKLDFTSTENKQLEINNLDIIFPHFLRKKNKATNILKKTNDILSKLISVDSIIKFKIQFEMLKELLLDTSQKILINGKSKVNLNYFDYVENKICIEDIKNKINNDVKKNINRSNLIKISKFKEPI